MSQPNDHDIPDSVRETAQDWLLRLTSGEVTEAELRSFEAWRDINPQHRAAYEEVRALWTGIDDLAHNFASVQHEMARATPKSGAERRRNGLSGATRRGIIMAGLAAAGLLFFVAATSNLPSGLMADHRTGVGEQAKVALPDGSVAYLNTNTAIDVEYSETRRRIRLLYGEALFEVRANSDRPFDVLALDGRTTAVGTAFSVRDSTEVATVTVTEGTVEVASPIGENISKRGMAPRVEADRQVSYRRGHRPGPVRALDSAVATAWYQGTIIIKDMPLSDALAEIGRYRSGRILLLRDASRLHSVTARIALQDIDSGIDAMAATHGLSVIRLTNYLVVLR